MYRIEICDTYGKLQDFINEANKQKYRIVGFASGLFGKALVVVYEERKPHEYI
jgi:hypothetical protein